MRIQFTRAFRGYQLGDVADVSERVARQWIEYGYATLLPKASEEVPEAKGMDAPPLDKAFKRGKAVRK